MPNCKYFLVTEAERKHVRRRARFQQHQDASCHQVFFPLQGKTPKVIHAILTETLEEHASSYATVKNWVAQFKSGDFSTCDAPRPGPKTATTPDIIDQFHELILEDCRISAKSIINLKEKRRGKGTKGVLFLHDNVPAHRALATQKKRAYLGFQCLDYYYLAGCTMFPHLPAPVWQL